MIRKRVGRNGTRYQVLIGEDHQSAGTYRTRAAAEAAQRQAIDRRERGLDVAAERARSRVTVADLFAEHQAHLRKKGRELGTLGFYAEAWKHVEPVCGSLAVRHFDLGTFDHLIERVAGRGAMLPSAIHRLLRAMLFFACRRRYIEYNPLSKRSGFDDAPAQPQSKARAVTAQEAARILQAARGHRLYEFWLLAFLTGARGGELVAITWSDVALDSDPPALTVSKALARIPKAMRPDGSTQQYYLKRPKSPDGKLRARVVPLDDVAVGALRSVWARQMREKRKARDGYEDQGLVFATPLGHLPSRNAISHAFTRLARSVGIDGVSLHSCRHAFATWSFAAGADRHAVAQAGGWSRPSFMIDRYCNAPPGGAVRAMALTSATLAQAQERLAADPKATTAQAGARIGDVT